MSVSVLAVCAALAASAPANAKEASNDVIFKPRITVSTEYDDNIYTENRDKDSALITRIRPQFLAKKGDRRNHVQVSGGLEQLLYSSTRDDNYLNYDAGISARHTIKPKMTWASHADYRRIHTRRGDNETNPLADSAEPLPLNLYRARTSLSMTNGPMTFAPRAEIVRHDYENVKRLNGTTIDRDVSDRLEYTVGARATFRVNGKTRLYADGAFTPRKYDERSTDRDSKGGQVLLGVRHHVTPAITIDAAAGYLGRKYDNDAFENIDTVAVRAVATWEVQEGTNIRADVTRRISETTSVGTGGALSTSVSAALEQKVTEALTANLAARYSYIDYIGGLGSDSGTSDRVDKRLSLSAGLSYALSDQLSLETSYTFINRESNRTLAEYNNNIIRIGVSYGF